MNRATRWIQQTKHGSFCATLKDQVKPIISHKKSDMANILDPMDLKQIITLHVDGLSNRKIGELLDILRNTVNDYMKLFSASDYNFDELLQLDNPKLKELFTSHTAIDNHRFEQLMVYFDQVNQARNHLGFTFQYHYNEYNKRLKTFIAILSL